MAKAKKKRHSNYDPKLSIKGSFEDVIKVSVTSTPEKKEDEKSVQKKEKK